MGFLTPPPPVGAERRHARPTRVVGAVLCHVGRHTPLPDAIWNKGYGFSRCERCGCDLVRSLIDDWQEVPRGHRVVWRTAAPTPAPTPVAAPSPAPAPAPAAPERTTPQRSAIERALDRLSGPAAGRASTRPPAAIDTPPAPPPSPAPRPTPVPTAPRATPRTAPVAAADGPPRSPFDFDDFDTPEDPAPPLRSNG